MSADKWTPTWQTLLDISRGRCWNILNRVEPHWTRAESHNFDRLLKYVAAGAEPRPELSQAVNDSLAQAWSRVQANAGDTPRGHTPR